MPTDSVPVGRIMRVGPGWADVMVGRRVRRVSTRPNLLLRTGEYLKISQTQEMTPVTSVHSDKDQM